MRFIDPTGLLAIDRNAFDSNNDDPLTPEERERRDKIDESVEEIKRLEELGPLDSRSKRKLRQERFGLKLRLGRLASSGSESSREWIRANMEINIIRGFYGEAGTDTYDGKMDLNFMGVTVESTRVQTWADNSALGSKDGTLKTRKLYWDSI